VVIKRRCSCLDGSLLICFLQFLFFAPGFISSGEEGRERALHSLDDFVNPDNKPLGFHDRLTEAILESSKFDVTYKDDLGEGPGKWDPDPRYPDEEVNCMTWLQYVLAEAYATNDDEKLNVMDALRYYGGNVGFSLRKHYIDRWTKLEPGPLSLIESPGCKPNGTRNIDLQLDHFVRKIGYSCPLYRMEARRFSVKFMDRRRVLDCVNGIQPGYYIMFAVASRHYLEIYGGYSGPMAQVHGVILEISDSRAGNGEHNEVVVHHASTSNGQVVMISMNEYLKSMRKLHMGYTIYGLDPYWKFPQKSKLSTTDQKLITCEESLKGRLGKIFEKEDVE